jgi:serine/threonine protein phosphatase 1
MRAYVIGDIHGQLDKLRAAHEMIELDRRETGDQEAEVVHLGDYVDRGPNSKGVIDFLIAGRDAGKPWRFLLGNHDRMFRLFFDDPHVQDPILRKDLTWLHEKLGGRDTLRSYGVTQSDTATPDELFAQTHRVPHEHRAFLAELEPFLETDHLYLAHAGVKPGVPLAQQTEDDLIWIRAEFHNSTANHGKLIVHGHTPVETATHYGNRVNLDTGAGYGRPLTTAVFEGRDCWLLTPSGRVPLEPNAAS